jgi:LDH2 family malate/lactate/ureidoglycolate dehydrogenase
MLPERQNPGSAEARSESMRTRVSPADLRTFLEALFQAAGYQDDDIREGAGAFLLQEMRGVQTHALRRLRQMIDDASTGAMNPRPQRRVLHESRATVIVDGDSGLGIASCMMGMEHALRLSKNFGVGFATVLNSNHFLAAAPYCWRAAEQGAVGMVFANGHSSMAYPGTNVGALGNSPVGYGVPTGAGFPIIFDAALTLSGGKLTQLAKESVEVPEGFLGYDAEGNFTRYPGAMLNGGVPLPIGLHKGGGLAVLIDVITGIIAGSTFLRGARPDNHPEWNRTTNTHSFIALNVETFMPRADFEERMAAYVRELKSRPLAPGYDEILLPGERAERRIRECERNGIPLEEDVVERLIDLSNRYAVSLPFPRPSSASE